MDKLSPIQEYYQYKNGIPTSTMFRETCNVILYTQQAFIPSVIFCIYYLFIIKIITNFAVKI